MTLNGPVSNCRMGRYKSDGGDELAFAVNDQPGNRKSHRSQRKRPDANHSQDFLHDPCALIDRCAQS